MVVGSPFDKALLFVEEMEEYTAEDWQFGLVGKPQPGNDRSGFTGSYFPHSTGKPQRLAKYSSRSRNPATSIGFVPTSVGTSEVLSILKELVPEFTNELFEACITHCVRRNAELHSGEEAFAGGGIFMTSKVLRKLQSTS